MIEQKVPSYGIEEIQAVTDYLHSDGWLTEFEKTRELEQIIATYVGTRHCIMIPNATLALYAMLKVLGVGQGDRVIVPAFTMVATANAVAMTGAMVAFVDIEEDTLCLNLDLLSDDLLADSKAILLVDLNGRSPNMNKVVALADEYNVLLLEDAAQALGSRWNGKHLGTFGTAGVFSFSPLKVITTGQGGCIVTDDDDLAANLRRFKDFGRPRGGTDEYLEFGINLKFTDLQAVFGLEQMKRLPQRVARMRAIHRAYQSCLKDVLQVRVLPMMNDTCPWFIDTLVERRDELQTYLLDEGIKTRPFYPALPQSPAWRYYKFTRCPVAINVSERGLWLPSTPTLTPQQIEYVCDFIKEFYASVDS